MTASKADRPDGASAPPIVPWPLRLLLYGALALTACGHLRSQKAEFSNCEAIIAAAGRLPASGQAPAKGHLERATGQLAEARRQWQSGRRQAAHLALIRARADASLALALASEQPMRAAADEAQGVLQAAAERERALYPAATEEAEPQASDIALPAPLSATPKPVGAP